LSTPAKQFLVASYGSGNPTTGLGRGGLSTSSELRIFGGQAEFLSSIITEEEEVFASRLSRNKTDGIIATIEALTG